MQQGKDPQKEGKSRGGGIIVVFAIVVVALLGVIIFLLLRKPEAENPTPAAVAATPEPRRTVVTSENVGDVVTEMEQSVYVPPSYYTVTMTNVWHFQTGDSVSGDAYVENVTANTNDIYFDVVLADDEDTTIISSPVIPLGATWEEIRLDQPLPAGSYDCVMIYHLIDSEQNTVTTLRVGLTIVVES